ncbi:hypothetical protein Tco_0788449 [Tanacetum coccineum]
MANDDPILTTMRFIPQHEVVQRYGGILPDYLTNPSMKESEAYKTYHDLAIGKVQPKPKYVRRSYKTKSDATPKPSSDIALTEAEKMKLAIESSKTQLHISQPSCSSAHEGTGVTLRVLDVPTYESDDEQISWKSSDEEDDDDEANVGKDEDDADHDDNDEQTESDNDVQTPSHVESTDDEEVQGVSIEGKAMDEEGNNEEDEGNELYRDLNVNLEGRDVEMTDDQLTNSSFVSSGFVSNMLNPRQDTGIDSIFTLNTEATSLVDVPVITIVEPPLVSAITLPPPPTPLITHMQQTPVPTLKIVPSSSLQDLPNFGSLFGFNHRLKNLETEFSKFKQTNQFANAVSSIPDIVEAYLADKMNKAIKTAVQSQSERLKDEALAENEAFLNSLDNNIKNIIKDQVKQQVNAQVSKILPRIKKAVNEQLKAKGSKRRRARKEPESTSAPKEKISKTTGKSTDGSKSQHKSAGESAHTEEPMNTDKDLEEPAHQEFDIGATEEQSDEETSQHPDWFQKPAKHPTPDRDWNNTLMLFMDQFNLVIPFDHFINNDLAYLSGGVSSRTYATSVTKTKATDYGHIKWIKDLVPNTMKESALDVYSKHRIIAVTNLQIVEWHGYKHLDWITVRKLTNLNVDDRLAFGVSLRMFTRSIIIQRRVEDLQLGVESYQKKLSITKPDTYRSDLKYKDAYTAYSNPRGFIYQNKDK